MVKAAKLGYFAIHQITRQKLGLTRQPELFYIVPGHNWVTDWVGHYITTQIRLKFDWRCWLSNSPQWIHGQIVHFGEVGTFIHQTRKRINQDNQIVVTIFHGDRSPNFPELADQVDHFLELSPLTQRVLTACRIMEERLVQWGIPPKKVIRIPLGVDLDHFIPAKPFTRLAFRNQFGIPDDAICIGSFQKDGVGWGEGLEPKMIKGPDVFLETINGLSKKHKLFVLLTSPARGYIKRGLKAIGVPYYHQVLQNYLDIRDYYTCLDLYLVTSREEGGPKSVLESLAMGVPLVSTRVGLAPDLIRHGHNGFLANVEDVAALTTFSQRVMEDPDLRKRLVSQGLEDIETYSWQKIAARYYHTLYRPLLTEMAQINV